MSGQPPASRTPELKAYIAGIIDGEGCIGIYCHRNSGNGYRSHYLVVTVNMTRPEALQLIHQHYGGTYRQQDRPEGKPRIVWAIRNWAAQQFLREILPYLTVKELQARLAIDYMTETHSRKLPARKGWSSGREAIPEQIWELRELYRQAMFSLNSGQSVQLQRLSEGAHSKSEKRQSELHGNMESPAEMTGPVS